MLQDKCTDTALNDITDTTSCLTLDVRDVMILDNIDFQIERKVDAPIWLDELVVKQSEITEALAPKWKFAHSEFDIE